MRYVCLALGLALSPLFGATTALAQKVPSGYDRNETPHVHGFRFTTAGEPVRRGNRAERYEVRHGDCGGSDCRAPRYRSEIREKRNATSARIGTDIWYGWSFFNESIPTFADRENLMPVVGQWKMGGDAAPIIKLVYHGGRKSIDVQLDDMKAAHGWGKSERFGLVCSLVKLDATRGRWTDFVVNTNFSTSEDGYLRIWVNGRQACDYRGPLVVNTSRSLYPGPNHRRGIFVSFTKRWDDVRGATAKPTMVAYFDEFLSGRTREEVDTRLREKAGLPPLD